VLSTSVVTNPEQVVDSMLHVLVFLAPRHKCWHLSRRQHPRMSESARRHPQSDWIRL